MPGIKFLGWKVPDCPGARIIKIEMIYGETIIIIFRDGLNVIFFMPFFMFM